MTTQSNLGLIWANTGGVTDPGSVKYVTGWVAEIPTFQNFNFVLQNHAKNLLVAAEQGQYFWQNNINYVAGTEVKEGTKKYFCIADHINQQPTLDTLNNYWIPGTVIGDAVATAGDVAKGMLLKDTAKQALALWNGNDITVESIQPLISLTSNGAGKNWLFGTVSGEMVMIDVNTTGAPDGRNIALGQAGVYRVYHEGHVPTQAEVTGTIPDSPQDGKLYARSNANWVEVTSTTVSIAPPPPVAGAGQGWYNLDDGQFYLDINDGDSSQWVPANPPVIPQVDAVDVDFDSTNVAGSASTVQGELELLDSMIGRKNLLINGDFRIAQRGIVSDAGTVYGLDRWEFNTGSANAQVRQNSFSMGSEVIEDPLYYMSTDKNGNTESLQTQWRQKIEGVKTLSGRTVTLSFLARQEQPMIVDVFNNFGSGGAPSSQDQILNGVVPTRSADGMAIWERNTLTFTMPNLSGKTLGDEGSYTLIRIKDAAGNILSSSIAQVQLEEGTAATKFEQRHIAEELALCQRYYVKTTHRFYSQLRTKGATNISEGAINWSFPVTMRTTPALSSGTVQNGTSGGYELATLAGATQIVNNNSAGNSTKVDGYTADAEL